MGIDTGLPVWAYSPQTGRETIPHIENWRIFLHSDFINKFMRAMDSVAPIKKIKCEGKF